jgi:hypothetical protein
VAIGMMLVNIALREDTIVAVSSEGGLYRCSVKKTQIKKVAMPAKVSSVGFGERETLFGRTSTGFLYFGKEVSKIAIMSAAVIQQNMVLVMRDDRVLEVLVLPSFRPLVKESKVLPLNSENEILRRRIFRERPVFSRSGRDAWLCLRQSPPFGMIGVCGSGDSRAFHDFEISFLKRATIDGRDKREALFFALLFADRWTEISDLLFEVDVKDKDYSYYVLISSLIMGFSNGVLSEQRVRLQESGLLLFQAGEFDRGSVFLRLGKCDRLAIDYCLEFGRLDIALNFLRGSLSDEDKAEAMLQIGGHLLKKGEILRSICFFASCREFHPLLFGLYSLGLISDCWFLKKWAKENGMLKGLDNPKQFVGGIVGFEELCHVIDAEFQSILCSLSIDLELFFPAI